MGKRGRTSAAETEMMNVVPLPQAARPEPPDDLSDEEAAVWRSTVANLPAGWFGSETMPLLVQYCRHASRAKSLAKIAARMEAEGIPDQKAYRLTLQAELQQSNAMSMLATKMRIAQQSTYDKKTKKTGRTATKLWEE